MIYEYEHLETGDVVEVDVMLADADVKDAEMRAQGYKRIPSLCAGFSFARGQAPKDDDFRREVQYFHHNVPQPHLGGMTEAEALKADKITLRGADTYSSARDKKTERREQVKSTLKQARAERAKATKISVQST